MKAEDFIFDWKRNVVVVAMVSLVGLSYFYNQKILDLSENTVALSNILLIILLSSLTVVLEIFIRKMNK